MHINPKHNIYKQKTILIMIRFVSGFLLGYIVAKKPPTQDEFNTMKIDIQTFFEYIFNKKTD